ncbi:MAG: TonB family protein [Bacteroidales bacterium]|nr:TonB family protein [Bacteroidales bacterium]
MKPLLLSAVLSFSISACAGQGRTGGEDIPVIRYNPASYFSDVESALAGPYSFECLSADSLRTAGVDGQVLDYLIGQNVFIITFTDEDASRRQRFFGIKDNEKGQLEYIDAEAERYLYSLDDIIKRLYGSMEDYIAKCPEDQRHLFQDNPEGMYVFNEWGAMSEVGYGNSTKPVNPVKFKAAISYLRSSRPEWNDDTWANDSTEIVKHANDITGLLIEVNKGDNPKFEDGDANMFSSWVKERLTYPDSALEDAASGRVTLGFTIDMFGNLEDVKVRRGRHQALDSVAVSVVSSSPKWKPGTDAYGNTMAVTYTFPVIFTPGMMFKAFITKMYNEKLYEDYGFLRKHCSPELLKKLQGAYPYDSDEPAYATWLFRSGQQDEKSPQENNTGLLDITADGDWYTYTALDMGWEFSKKIKLSCTDNLIVIEDLEIK